MSRAILHIVFDDDISHPFTHRLDMLAPAQTFGDLAVLAVEPEDVLLARAAPLVEIDGVGYVLAGLTGHLPTHRREGRVGLLKRVLR
ncbi:hypothetical protein UFOVP340_16 [uncultured Caudovirales phage]|uniref:Uncharacterized protein n=1 Tax=uncultured Caudovirales phage TaxID=2100421 RepID=A0A6J5LXA6_9CAUD|nr:hypothetical protein UFOVP340_16 [uncultured Caudovirales phage]